jgi:hypothetical protein
MNCKPDPLVLAAVRPVVGFLLVVGALCWLGLMTAYAQPAISIVHNGNGTVGLSFEGKLQAAPTVTGPYSDVDGPSSPLTLAPDQAMQFFRCFKEGAYSKEILGYINKNIPTGISVIGNPLNKGGNTVSEIFGKNLATTVTLYSYGNGAFAINSYHSDIQEWDNPDQVLSPGQGFIVRNRGSGVNVTFVGEVPQGDLSNALPRGFSIRSSQVPQEGKLDADLGFPGTGAPVVYQFVNGFFSMNEYDTDFGEWEPIPVIGVGEAFWVRLNDKTNWKRSVRINDDSAIYPSGSSPEIEVDMCPNGKGGINFTNLFPTKKGILGPDGNWITGGWAQLYAGTTNGNLSPVGSPVAIYGDKQERFGYFSGGFVCVGFRGEGLIQVKAWQDADSFEASTFRGESNVFKQTPADLTASPPEIPADLTGLEPFSFTGFLADTDNDGLDDRREIKTLKTDPNKVDSDEDGHSDWDEVLSSTDPLDPESAPAFSTLINGNPFLEFFAKAGGSALLSFNDSTGKGTILYTLDGADPMEDGLIYEEPVEIRQASHLKVVLLDPGLKVVGRGEKRIFIVKVVSMEIEEPWTYLSLTPDSPEARVYYSLDNSDPVSRGLEYKDILLVKKPATLKVASILDDVRGELSSGVDIQILPAYKLFVHNPGGGQVVVSPQKFRYLAGETIQLSATAGEGWEFMNWRYSEPLSGQIDSSKPDIEIEINDTAVLLPVFGTGINPAVIGQGKIRLNPQLDLYPCGSELIAMALPGEGRYLSQWGGALSGKAPVTRHTVTEPEPAFTALFGRLPEGKFNLTVTVGGPGRVRVDPPRNLFDVGEEVTLTAEETDKIVAFKYSGDLDSDKKNVNFTIQKNTSINAGFVDRNILQNGLVAYYPFNGNANDESGNGNNGTVRGATLAEDRFETTESAYFFDGGSQVVVEGSIFSDDTTWTISFWLKDATSGRGNDNTIIATYPGDDGVGFMFRENHGSLQFAYLQAFNGQPTNFGTNNETKLKGQFWKDSKWHKFTFVCMGENGTDFYFDNEKIYNFGGYHNTVPSLYLGGKNVRGKFYGWLDDIRIYNRALSEEEVSFHYFLDSNNEFNELSEELIYEDELNRLTRQPTISSINPLSGVHGVELTVVGENLGEITGLTINGRSTPYKVVSDSLVTAYIQADTETGPVKVVSPNGSATSPIHFTVTGGVSTDLRLSIELKEDRRLTLQVHGRGDGKIQLQSSTDLIFWDQLGQLPLINGYAELPMLNNNSTEYFRAVKTLSP